MKRILVNMNCSGYFWHELSNTSLLDSKSENPVVKMKREISGDSHPSILAMRTYEQYNYVFMKGDGDYILAIRNLNDPRTDGSGRSLKQHVIFEDDDKDLLLKLLAFYLTSPAKFEEWMTGECFKPGQNDALCKLAPFYKKIEKIKKATLHPSLKGCDFAISSLQSAKWLQEKLKLPNINVAEHLNKLDAMKGTKFLTLYNEVQVPQEEGHTDTRSQTEKPLKEDHTICEKTINRLENEKQKLLKEKQQLEYEKQQLQSELKTKQKNLKKSKLYVMALVVVAIVSILVLIYNALNN